MADIDVLPSRGIRRMALVDADGVATNGSSTVDQLAAKGMQSVCAVDGSGNATTGSGTMLQLAQRGIKAFCPVDENGVALDASTAATLRQRGIRPMVLLNNSGVALTGSATMLTLVQRGLECFCPLDESGNATTMGAVVLLSNATVLDNATIGSTIGTLSVSGGTGTYTFTLTSNPGSLFVTAGTNGVNLNTAATLTAGSYPITVQAAGGVPTPVSRSFIITVIPSPVAPANSIPPVISGSTVSGNLLTATNGTWTGFPAPTFTYQWKRGATNVGTNANTYTTVVANEGFNITCVVTGTNVAGNASATSNSLAITAPVVGGMTLAWTSANTVYDPVFTLTFYGAVVGDVLTLQIDDNSDFSSLYTSASDTLDSAEIAAGTITYAGITTLLPGVTYYARVKMTRASVDTYSNTVSQTMFIDSVAPTVVSYSPADNATGIGAGVELVVTFSETVVLGTGTISLKKTSDNSTIDSWNVATAVGSTAGKVQIVGGTTLHIHLTSNLALGIEYYVVWPAGVVKDIAGNNVAAQSSTTIWSFTTSSVAAPTWTKKASTFQDIAYTDVKCTLAAAINNTSASDVIVVGIDDTATPVSITIGGNAMTPVATSSSGQSGMYMYTGAIFTTTNIVVTNSTGMGGCAMTVGVLTGVNPTPAGAPAVMAESFYPTTQTTSTPLTVPSTGFGIVLHKQTSVIGVTPNGGMVEDYDLTGTMVGNDHGLFMGHITSTGTPSVDGDPYVGSAMMAVAWGP